MSKRKIYEFLRDLADNNSKRWMDANRDRYEEAKNIWTETCQNILDRLAKLDDFYADLEASDTVERINNNLMYHPDKPTYKDHFGFSPNSGKGVGFYVSVSPAYSFIGGGMHKPSNDQLKPLREAIDKKGDELLDILSDKKFQDYFEGLEEDPDALKTSPKGYDQEHEYIELLRRKNFTVSKRITQEDVLSDDFPKIVEEAFKRMLPLQQFIRDTQD